MAKLDWQTRWENTLKEKLIRFTMSPDREQLYGWLENAGFGIKFKKRQQFAEFDLANEEIAKTLKSEACPYSLRSKNALMWWWCKWKRTDDYGQFLDKCIKAERKYGLRWQTIFEALFLPQEEVKIEPFTKPQWFLEPIFHYMDKDMTHLQRELAPGMALRWKSEPPPSESQEHLSDVEATNIFTVVVEFPLDYPSEGVLQMGREATEAARILCRTLGRQVKQRVRGKPILANATLLQLHKPLLSRDEVYEMIDNLYPDGNIEQDRKRQRQIISQRHKGKKHLIPL